jgi:predicted secreted protein
VATPLTGLDGTVEIGGAVVASMRSWTMTIEMDAQEVGGFGSQWEIQKPGRKSYGGSVEGVWAYGDASGQGAVQTAAEAATEVTLTLGVDASHSYVSLAYITNLEVGAEYDGVTTFNFEWVGSGVDGPTSLASHG